MVFIINHTSSVLPPVYLDRIQNLNEIASPGNAVNVTVRKMRRPGASWLSLVARKYLVPIDGVGGG